MIEERRSFIPMIFMGLTVVLLAIDLGIEAIGAGHPPVVRIAACVAGVVGLVSAGSKIRAHRRLGEIRKRYIETLEHIGQVVWVERLAPEHRIVYMNPAYERVFGLSRESAYRNPDAWKRLVDPEDCSVIEAAIPELPVTGGRFEYQIVRPDGESRWIRSRLFAISTNRTDGVELIVGIAEDITRLKEAVASAEQNRAQLIQAEKLASLGTLVAGIAHEINNPNHTIMATSAILEEAWTDLGPLLDEYAEEYGDFTIAGTGYEDFRQSMPLYLEGLSTASDRIRDIVAHLRDFARQDVYDTDTPSDLNEIVAGAVSLMKSHIQKHTARFSFVAEPGLPPIEANSSRLQQVVVNLLRNACQALETSHDLIEVTTGLLESGDQVLVVVRDEGAGINSADLDRVFDPFYTTRRTAGGMGLGLSVSQSIVEDHGGSLRVDSVLGEGTTVTISLPVGIMGSAEG